AFSEITDEGINSTIALISVATGEIFAKSLYNPEQTISQLSFMDGNRLLAISDTRIFAMNAANASEIWEEPLNMRISASAVTNAHLVITHAPSNVIVYDSTGGEILDMQKYTALTSIYLNFEHIILGTRGRFYGYNLRGENLWELQLPSGTDLRFMGNRNALVAKTPTSLRIFNGSN
ncbi:MAG: PQQ-like beta-propeller repeat protein, partial [Defluviitaleaceae bacterium]|nr:PQQ-like beta-propeller repeat protein [Defluviitaleaceae bacterium]